MMALLSRLPGWLPIVAAAVTGGLLVGLLRQPTINGLRDDLTAAQVRAGVAESANVQCQADVTESRLAVAKVLREADERAARAAAAVAEAEGRVAGLEGEVAQLRRRPPSSSNVCEAISDLRREDSGGKP